MWIFDSNLMQWEKIKLTITKTKSQKFLSLVIPIKSVKQKIIKKLQYFFFWYRVTWTWFVSSVVSPHSKNTFPPLALLSLQFENKLLLIFKKKGVFLVKYSGFPSLSLFSFVFLSHKNKAFNKSTTIVLLLVASTSAFKSSLLSQNIAIYSLLSTQFIQYFIDGLLSWLISLRALMVVRQYQKRKTGQNMTEYDQNWQRSKVKLVKRSWKWLKLAGNCERRWKRVKANRLWLYFIQFCGIYSCLAHFQLFVSF